MDILIVANDPPYGTERLHNALRLAHSLGKADPVASVSAFLMGDAMAGALAGQRTPEGCHDVGRVLSGGGSVRLCGTCMDARGITDAHVTEGAKRSTMDELGARTLTADKVLVF
jgi:uncharacterized protein involved in oxidation of intracellular sulfur